MKKIKIKLKNNFQVKNGMDKDGYVSELLGKRLIAAGLAVEIIEKKGKK